MMKCESYTKLYKVRSYTKWYKVLGLESLSVIRNGIKQ